MRTVFVSSVIVAIISVLVFKEQLLSTITTWASRISDSYQLHEQQTLIPLEDKTTPAAANMSVPRPIRKVFLAVEQAEGAGARVRRSIGTPQLRNFSPFLMLDHFSVTPGSGFSDHPHRGQEVKCIHRRLRGYLANRGLVAW